MKIGTLVCPQAFRSTDRLNNMLSYWDSGERFCEKVMSSETYMTQIWNGSDGVRYDAILTSAIFNDCALGMVHKTKAPLIVVSTLGPVSWIAKYMGNPVACSYTPSPMTAFTNRQASFFQELFFSSLSSISH
jgi:hypothetical protein